MKLPAFPLILAAVPQREASTTWVWAGEGNQDGCWRDYEAQVWAGIVLRGTGGCLCQGTDTNLGGEVKKETFLLTHEIPHRISKCWETPKAAGVESKTGEMPGPAREEQEGRRQAKQFKECVYSGWPGETGESKIIYLKSQMLQFVSLGSPATPCQGQDTFWVSQCAFQEGYLSFLFRSGCPQPWTTSITGSL